MTQTDVNDIAQFAFLEPVTVPLGLENMSLDGKAGVLTGSVHTILSDLPSSGRDQRRRIPELRKIFPISRTGTGSARKFAAPFTCAQLGVGGIGCSPNTS